MSFGENTLLNPFQIEEAREAEHAASKSQRKHADALAKAYGDLANAEYAYRVALSARWKELKEAGWAATVCGDIARGEESIAALRRDRDRCEGEVERLKELSYTLGADRRALDGLISWSEHREMRVDAEPSDWTKQPTDGRGVPPGVDPRTGEVRGS